MTRPLIYLAGPDVFRADAKEYSASLKRVCASVGLEALWPLDQQIEAQTPIAAAYAIRNANVALIERCDAVVANISPFRGPNMDPGTAWELGYAAALRKPIFPFSYDLRPLLDRTLRMAPPLVAVDHEFRDANGMLIENFCLPENLMIACSVKSIYDCAAEAIFAAADSILAPLRKAAG